MPDILAGGLGGLGEAGQNISRIILDEDRFKRTTDSRNETEQSRFKNKIIELGLRGKLGDNINPEFLESLGLGDLGSMFGGASSGGGGARTAATAPVTADNESSFDLESALKGIPLGNTKDERALKREAFIRGEGQQEKAGFNKQLSAIFTGKPAPEAQSANEVARQVVLSGGTSTAGQPRVSKQDAARAAKLTAAKRAVKRKAPLLFYFYQELRNLPRYLNKIGSI